jgi:hypothetical protein
MQYIQDFDKRIKNLKAWMNINKGILYQVENLETEKTSIRKLYKVNLYIEGIVLDNIDYYQKIIRSDFKFKLRDIQLTQNGFIFNGIYEYKFIEKLDEETEQRLKEVKDICENNNIVRYSTKKLLKMFEKSIPINNMEYLNIAAEFDIRFTSSTLRWIRNNLVEIYIQEDLDEKACIYKYIGNYESSKIEEISFDILTKIRERRERLKPPKKKFKKLRSRIGSYNQYI